LFGNKQIWKLLAKKASFFSSLTFDQFLLNFRTSLPNFVYKKIGEKRERKKKKVCPQLVEFFKFFLHHSSTEFTSPLDR
jgi:hypothetical protein